MKGIMSQIKKKNELGGINSTLGNKRKDYRTWRHSSRNYPRLFKVKHDWNKGGQNFSKLWFSFKQSHLHVIVILRGEFEEGKGTEIFLFCVFIFIQVTEDIMANIFSNVMKIINLQI